MRTIKFRGLDENEKKWVYGDLITNDGLPFIVNRVIDSNEEWITIEEWQPVTPETVGQFTGLTDKDGEEIYEGDVLQYYAYKRYIQQSHYDVRPEIDELVITGPFKDKVVFIDGCFALSKTFNEEDFPFISPINQFGLFSVERVKEEIFEDRDLDEEEKQSDCHGTEINESIIGIKIIGNIHTNPELLNNKS